MLQALGLKRLLATGVQLSGNRWSHARRVRSELAAQGRLTTKQTSAALDVLVARARRRNEELQRAVRRVVQHQVHRLGLVTKDDLATLEVRFASVTASPTRRTANRNAARTPVVNKLAAKKST